MFNVCTVLKSSLVLDVDINQYLKFCLKYIFNQMKIQRIYTLLIFNRAKEVSEAQRVLWQTCYRHFEI